jgi:hypothetical protein
MLRNTLVALLLCGTSLSQAASVETTTTDASFDVVVLSTVVAGIDSKNTNNGQQPIAHVRALFAMEDSGIRNLYPELSELKAVGEYVVNCAEQSLAITEFRVVKSSDILPASMNTVTDEKLTFSSPKFDSEVKVVRAACGSSVASLSNNLQ